MNDNRDLDFEKSEVDEEPFVDLNPERDFADVDRLARILDLSPRQIRRLAADKIIRAEKAGPYAGMFKIRAAIRSEVSYRSTRKARKDDRLAVKQTERLDRQMARDDLVTISMSEALDGVDHISRALQLAVDKIGREIAPVVADPARAATAIANTKSSLAKRFREERDALENGKSK